MARSRKQILNHLATNDVCISHFTLLWQNTWHLQRKTGESYFGSQFQWVQSMVGWLQGLEEDSSGSMAARSRARRKSQGQDTAFQVMPQWPPLPVRPHLPVARSAVNSSVHGSPDEHTVPWSSHHPNTQVFGGPPRSKPKQNVWPWMSFFMAFSVLSLLLCPLQRISSSRWLHANSVRFSPN